MNGTISLDDFPSTPIQIGKLRPRLHLLKVTQHVRDEAEPKAKPPLTEEGKAIVQGRGARHTHPYYSTGHLGLPSREVKAQDTGPR